MCGESESCDSFFFRLIFLLPKPRETMRDQTNIHDFSILYGLILIQLSFPFQTFMNIVFFLCP